ncbi:DUF2304 domain-containing protein [Nocardioides cavernae]|uniref:DUF2304 domain-containing protein n=1 Tax=Nocardioides cavernae TaxID=1921566 RepID=A0ABR8NFZ2_9ACTN|nr:DUF2304 domain-containing protein [Nocardioides cavernae]MBD3926656.1 DUF2304 domain-containing protein [Nocardioides cavernae]MBM7512378.1 hypothetical protein [Nocardioides cavernae]
MIVVQLLLVSAFLGLFFLALRSRTAHGVSASKKLGFLLFMLVVVVAVLSPALVSAVANLVGVGRGTDLVLYLLAVVVCFYVVNDYLRAQDSRAQLHKLARRIAVLEALERYDIASAQDRDKDVTSNLPDPHESTDDA